MTHRLSVEKLWLVFGKKPKAFYFLVNKGVSVNEAQKKTHHTLAVQDISFHLNSGEILVLMGLSGSGKSSLIRCLNGMNGRGNGLAKGKITFRDSKTRKATDILNCSEKELREIRKNQISMVFQQIGLIPWKTVWENVAYPLEMQKIPKSHQEALVTEKLKRVGLLSWKSHYPSQLSGGMQQRVGLARAFVTGADLLLMDEPFSALDSLNRRDLQNEVLQLQKEFHKTIVFVTHDFKEAELIGDRIAVIESGRLLQIATPEEILASPETEQVRQLIG
jgi:glycine betaine/proline transport system ATP-binding protein